MRGADSLRRQLLRGLLLPLLGLMALSCAVSYWVARSYAGRAYDYNLGCSARSLVQQVHVVKGHVQVDLPPAARAILLSDPLDQVYFQVSSVRGGRIMASAPLPLPGWRPPLPGSVMYYDLNDSGRPPLRVAAMSILPDRQDPDSRLWVQVAETRVKRERYAHQILLAVLLPQVLILLAAVALLTKGVRRGLAPLQRVAEEIADRGHHDLAPLPEHQVPEEVRPLVGALNDLLDRLRGALSAQRRFIADAAHQLRTPLAGISIQTERARKAATLEEARPALEQLQLAAGNTVRLANQLLTLARAEPGADPRSRFVAVDLTALARQVCMDWVPRALSCGADLGFVGDRPAVIQGDALLLAEMLHNLIDNALRYGRANGSVTVRIEGGRPLRLTVVDDGPGIPAADRERVFERFQRLDDGRPGGCGLGLAIVREIARAHGAEVRVETPAAGVGTELAIEFAAA